MLNLIQIRDFRFNGLPVGATGLLGAGSADFENLEHVGTSESHAF
jgi:hypothetical protein